MKSMSPLNLGYCLRASSFEKDSQVQILHCQGDHSEKAPTTP